MTALRKTPPPLPKVRSHESGTQRRKLPPPLPATYLEVVSAPPSIPPDFDLTADWFPEAAAPAGSSPAGSSPAASAPAASAPPASFAQARCIDADLQLLQRDARRRRVMVLVGALMFVVSAIALGM